MRFVVSCDFVVFHDSKRPGNLALQSSNTAMEETSPSELKHYHWGSLPLHSWHLSCSSLPPQSWNSYTLPTTPGAEAALNSYRVQQLCKTSQFTLQRKKITNSDIRSIKKKGTCTFPFKFLKKLCSEVSSRKLQIYAILFRIYFMRRWYSNCNRTLSTFWQHID